MTKTKTVTITISAWVITALFAAAAVFSTEGLGIVVQNAEWLNPIFTFVGNFVPVLATISMLLVAFLWLLATQSEKFLGMLVGANIKEADYDLAKAKHKIRFRWFQFIFLSLPYWILLIGVGWIYSGIMTVIAGVGMQFFQFTQRKMLDEFADEFSEDELKEAVDSVLEDD